MTAQELKKVEQFRKQQFFKGFGDELKEKTIIKKFFTPNGRNEAALIEIDGNEYEVVCWYSAAFCANPPKGYLMDYQLTTHNLKGNKTILQFSAYTHHLLNSEAIIKWLGIK